MDSFRLVTTVTRRASWATVAGVQQCDGPHVRVLKRCGLAAADVAGYGPRTRLVA
jgi:hypothetical protein